MGSLERFPEIYEYIRPVLDIGVLAFILYKMYGLIVKTQSLQIIKFGFTVLTAYVIALILNLSMLLWLLHLLAPGVLIGFAIVFQPELRKIIFKLGQTQWFKFRRRTKHAYIDSVLIAAEMLSKQKRGMLAVFTRKTSLKDIMDTGTYLNADLTSSLLVTIFGHDTPLHDGAAVIQDGKITAAGCFFALVGAVRYTQNLRYPPQGGPRRIGRNGCGCAYRIRRKRSNQFGLRFSLAL